jgi:hypothetical protein
MMPDVTYSMERYFQDANRRIEVSKFWNSGWKEHMKWAQQQTDGLKDFWNDFNSAFKPVEDTKWNQRFRTYYSFEVGRLLFLSPSVAHKHFLKQTGNVSMFGPGPVIGNMKKAWSSELTARFSKPQYRDIKLPSGRQMNGYERSTLIKAMSNQGTFNNVINDLDIGDLPMNRIQDAMSKWNEKGAVMVDFIEKFDRGNSILMAAEMAGKKGMTPEQAAHSIYDTIIKANFLSGVSNPNWLRSPKIRAFLMFQGTPYKLMEQRTLRTLGAVKAGTNAYKRLTGRLDDLAKLKVEMKGAENEFKANLIMDSLNADTDIFGTNIGTQFMRNVLALGTTAFAYGHITDGQLWPQLFHPPFVKPTSNQISLIMSPQAQAIYKATQNKTEGSWYISDVLKQYFSNGKNIEFMDLLPVNAKKAIRMLRGDNPQLYGDETTWRST